MKYNRRKTSYPFVLDDYNLIDDVYHAVRDNERVVFLVRHGERWFDYSPEWGLIESWISKQKPSEKDYSDEDLKILQTIITDQHDLKELYKHHIMFDYLVDMMCSLKIN